MRQIYIDLTTDTARLPGGDFVGYIGEHNATELLVSVPYKMIDESDYQVLVFQAGPFLFRSKHIDTDKEKETYRDGNTIHTLLSKSLTKLSNLSLQVEAYKVDNDGTVTLIGKTPLVPRLTLRKAPDGQPAFNYDGSYQDIEGAIEYAHKHNNIDVLNLFDNVNGTLYFNGKSIQNIQSFSTPSALPETADEGTIAFAENDDVVNSANVVERDVHYYGLKPKLETEITDFSLLEKVFELSDDGAIDAQYNLRMEEYGLYMMLNFMYIKDVYSIMIIEPSQIEDLKIEVNPFLLTDTSEEYYYAFNPGEEINLKGYISQEDCILPHGWSIIAWYETYTAIGTSYITWESQQHFYTKPLPDSAEVLTAYIGASIYNEDEAKDSDAEREFLSSLFDVVEDTRKKGLYIYTNGKWQNLSKSVENQIKLVSSFLDLPYDATEGTTAFVINDDKIIQTDDSIGISVSTSPNTYGLISFNPRPCNRSKFVECEITFTYGTSNGKDFVSKGVAFTITTNNEEGYILLLKMNASTFEYENYIYAYDDYTVHYDESTTIDVKQGWSKMDVVDGKIVTTNLPLLEAPVINLNSTHYRMAVSTIKVTGFDDVTGMTTDLFCNGDLISKSGMEGEWINLLGKWLPIALINQN